MYTMIGYTQPQLKISTTFLIAFIHIYMCVNIKYIYLYYVWTICVCIHLLHFTHIAID